MKKTLLALAVFSVMSSANASAISGVSASGIDESKVIEQDYVLRGAYDVGVLAQNGGNLSFTGENITIDTTPGNGWGSGNVGVWAAVSENERSVINLGAKGITDRISINVVDNAEKADIAVGLWAKGDTSHPEYNGGLVNVNSNDLVITGNSKNGWIYGVYAQNGTTSAKGDLASVVINANNTIIDVSSSNPGQASAIVAMSQGKVEINGNLYVRADNVITVRGDSEVNINKGSAATNIKLNGDVSYDYDKATSATEVNSVVNITLNGENSYWNGNAKVTYGTGEPPQGYDEVTGLTVNISDGAQWVPTVVDESSTPESGIRRISINNMALNQGVIVLSEDLVQSGQAVSIDKMSSNDGVIRTYVQKGSDGQAKMGVVEIGDLADSGRLNVVAENVTADELENANATLKGLAKVVSVTEASGATIQAVVEEGDVLGAITQTFNTQGEAKGQVVQAKNSKLSSFSSVNATNLLQWRHEMNDLTKRMGELRTSPEGVGTWARLYGSEQEYGNTGTETKNTTIQVGADYDVGAGWKVGAAFSYTDSSSCMNNGSADGDMYGLAVYGTWFNDDGQFLDLIGKYSRMSTDFTAGNMSGDYDNNAYSVSVEYGWHLKFNDLAFVEPQAELTYGQVMGDDFTTSNAVRIEQDDVDSFIGRLGVRGGFFFPENKGTIYARASVLHDFDGESSFKASNTSAAATYMEDMGGTWYEFGIGANFNLTDATYTYVDLEKSTGGDVKENWRWNVGLRHVW